MITKEQMKAAGFVPIVYGKYDGRGWTKTLHDDKILVELCYTSDKGFTVDVTLDDEFSVEDVCTVPINDVIDIFLKGNLVDVELP